jgi:hypothetical protein
VILAVLCLFLGASVMWMVIVYHSVWVHRRQPMYKNPNDTGQWKTASMVNLQGGRTRTHGDRG